MNGLIPVCVRKCTLRRDLFGYFLSQFGNVHLYGRILWWIVRMWILRLLLLENALVQMLHVVVLVEADVVVVVADVDVDIEEDIKFI